MPSAKQAYVVAFVVEDQRLRIRRFTASSPILIRAEQTPRMRRAHAPKRYRFFGVSAIRRAAGQQRHNMT
jgi:hypothetical protein